MVDFCRAEKGREREAVSVPSQPRILRIVGLGLSDGRDGRDASKDVGQRCVDGGCALPTALPLASAHRLIRQHHIPPLHLFPYPSHSLAAMTVTADGRRRSSRLQTATSSTSSASAVDADAPPAARSTVVFWVLFAPVVLFILLHLAYPSSPLLLTLNRYYTALFFAAASLPHLLTPSIYDPLIPPSLPHRDQLQLLLGLLLLAASALLALPHPSLHTRGFSLLLLCLVLCLPSNLYWALSERAQRGVHLPGWFGVVRLPLQFVFLWWVAQQMDAAIGLEAKSVEL